MTIGNTGKNKIGMWGQRHKRYLKSHHRMLYCNLLTSDKLNIYLADVECQAENLFEQTVKSFAERGKLQKNSKQEI